MKLKHACADAGQYGVNVSPDEYRESGIRMIRTSDLGGGRLASPDGGVFLEGPVPASQVLQPDDLLLSRAGTIGRSYLAPTEAAGMTFAGFLVRFRPLDNADARFLQYAIQSKSVQEQITSQAVTSTIQNFNADRYANLELPDADLREQRRTADFLDDRVSRIDRIIAARHEQSRLMREAARSQISSLVTEGRSGWVVGQLRRFVASHDRVRVPLSSEERSRRQGDFPYYGASGVIDCVDAYLFEGPRVLLSEDGANLLIRNSPVAFVADGRYWVNNHAHILEPEDGAHHFWAARIESLDISRWVSGSAQPKLTIDAAMSLPISAPSEVAERHEIGSAVLEVSCSERERVEDLRRSINVLTEYKSSLITAAVTGEMDVTTAGSRIPG